MLTLIKFMLINICFPHCLFSINEVPKNRHYRRPASALKQPRSWSISLFWIQWPCRAYGDHQLSIADSESMTTSGLEDWWHLALKRYGWRLICSRCWELRKVPAIFSRCASQSCLAQCKLNLSTQTFNAQIQHNGYWISFAALYPCSQPRPELIPSLLPCLTYLASILWRNGTRKVYIEGSIISQLFFQVAQWAEIDISILPHGWY